MIDNRQKISVAREAHMADPALRFVNHVANREFQVQLSERAGANNGERLSVGRPVSPKHLVKHLAWRASRQWNACQSSSLRESAGGRGFSEIAISPFEEMERTCAGDKPSVRESVLSKRVEKISWGWPSHAAP